MKEIILAIKKAGNQKRLAEICGVSQSAISQWATDQTIPSPKFVGIILKKLEIDLRFLHPDVFGTDDPATPPILPVPHPEQQEKELPKVSAPEGTKKRRKRDERRREPAMAE